MTLEDYEFELYKKYKRPRILDEEDKDYIQDLESIGLFYIGLTTNTLGNIPKETAKLTSLGLEKLRYEKIKRNPIRNALDIVISLLN